MRLSYKSTLSATLALFVLSPSLPLPAQTPSPAPAPTAPFSINGPGSTLSQAPRPEPGASTTGKRQTKARKPRKKQEEIPYGLQLMSRFDLLPYYRDTRCVQDSSYDRSGGNGDSGNFFKKEGNKATLSDIRGPGCLYRFWSANAAGHLKIFFDGESTPRIDCEMQDLFKGKVAPFVAPIVGHKSGGWYSFFPMPFQKGCRIEVTDPGSMYYHVEYQLFPDDTEIRTFTRDLTKEDQLALNTIVAQWNHLGDDPKPAPTKQFTIRAGFALAPGETRTLGDIKGAAQVNAFRLKITPADRQTLRQTLLRVYWDGATRPAIEAPVGDFFGVGFGNQTVKSLPTALTETGGVCYWPMPFFKSAHFEIVNQGQTNLTNADFTVTYAPLSGPHGNRGYFHAQFHRQKTVSGEHFHILDVTGHGHYVGEHTDMQGDHGLSFLEGDEKMYVDGETFPSIYGTGTEDFYTGGWYFDEGTFNLAYHGCSVKDDELFRVSAYRYQIQDLVPFQKSLKVDIEHGDANNYPGADYSCVAYWYLDAPTHDWSPVRLEDLSPAHFKVADVLEAENLLWSGSQVTLLSDIDLPLEASNGKVMSVAGANAAFTLPVDTEDVYKVHLAYLGQPNGPDNLRVTVSDVAAENLKTGGIDLPLNKETQSKRSEVSFTTRLTPGRHTVTVLVPEGKKLLLDYVRLERSHTEKDVVEAESLETSANTDGTGDVSHIEGPDYYSGRSALVWYPRGDNATLRLPLTIGANGDYTLEVAMDRHPNGPQVAARIDEGPAFFAIDLYADKTSNSQRLRFGPLPGLKAGAHTLTLLYKGKNKAVDQPAVYIDYIHLPKSRYANSVETASLKVLEAKDGETRTQEVNGFGASGRITQFWFLGQKTGAEATLELPVTYTGTYNLSVYFTTARDYATVQTLIDGKEIGPPVDCYTGNVLAKGRTTLGSVALTAGTHRLTFRAVAKNPASTNYLIGVDAITLDPVK